MFILKSKTQEKSLRKSIERVAKAEHSSRRILLLLRIWFSLRSQFIFLWEMRKYQVAMNVGASERISLYVRRENELYPLEDFNVVFFAFSVSKWSKTKVEEIYFRMLNVQDVFYREEEGSSRSQTRDSLMNLKLIVLRVEHWWKKSDKINKCSEHFFLLLHHFFDEESTANERRDNNCVYISPVVSPRSVVYQNLF